MRRVALASALVLALVFGTAVNAYAATESGTTVIQAAVNSRLVLTVPGNHNFGTFNPDAAAPAPYSANVNVRSNVDFTLVRTNPTNTFPTGMLSVPLATGMDGSNQNKAPGINGRNYAQVFTLTLAPGDVWADPGNYSSSYLYTATY